MDILGIKNTGSQLKRRALRVPGESLAEEVEDRSYEQLVFPLIVVVLFTYLAMDEWARYFHPREPRPWIATIVFVLVAPYQLSKLLKNLRTIRYLNEAKRLEVATAQYLDRFKKIGYRIYHDVPVKNGRVSHVMVGERGVFSIDVLTLRKPREGECKITMLNGNLHSNGTPLEGESIKTCIERAKGISEILKSMTTPVEVKQVLTIPGWYVDIEKNPHGIMILETKALDAFVKNMPSVLDVSAVNQIAKRIQDHVRGQEIAS